MGFADQLKALSENVKNLEDVIKVQQEQLSRIRNDPMMPRRENGVVQVPALEGAAAMQEPRAKARMKNAIQRTFSGPKQRTYLQRFPEKYEGRLPPRVEYIPVPTSGGRRPGMRPPAAVRTRFNRIDGMYYEYFDAATGRYVKGPTIQTFDQVRAHGDREREARDRYFAERNARYKAAVIRGAGGEDGYYKRSVRARADAARSLGMDPLKLDSPSMRYELASETRARESFDADMKRFEEEAAARRLPRPKGREEELTYRQSRAFGELLRVRGVPSDAVNDLKHWTDNAGNLYVWRRVEEGWEGRKIPPSGVTVDLGVQQELPPQDQNLEVPVAPQQAEQAVEQAPVENTSAEEELPPPPPDSTPARRASPAPAESVDPSEEHWDKLISKFDKIIDENNQAFESDAEALMKELQEVDLSMDKLNILIAYYKEMPDQRKNIKAVKEIEALLNSKSNEFLR